MCSKIPELDGIRGIAILLVLLCHMSFWKPFSALQPILFEGRVGVDLFFVLSGFLITGILLDGKGTPDAVKHFYIRRILRIWPLYFLTLAVLFVPLRRFLPANATIWPYLAFIQNLMHSQNQGPFLQPFWSLAVEEQFYLVWPWVVLRTSLEGLEKLCVGLFVSAVVARIVLVALHVPADYIYVNTLCRTDAIAIGSLLAIYIRQTRSIWHQLPRPGYLLTISILGFAIGILTPRLFAPAQCTTSFAAIGFAVLITQALAKRGTNAHLARFLRHKSLMYLGQISFAVYLFNFPIYSLCHGSFVSGFLQRLHIPVSVRALVCAVLANMILLSAGTFSWRVFENPILSLKGRLAPKTPRKIQVLNVPSFAEMRGE